MSMADAPPAPPTPPAPVPSPVVPPVQPPIHPALPIPAQPMQLAHVPQLNWSHFKPEFAGTPDENAEIHLPRKNDWMDTHASHKGVKIPRFLFDISRRSKIII